jgi:predicted secreted protein
MPPRRIAANPNVSSMLFPTDPQGRQVSMPSVSQIGQGISPGPISLTGSPLDFSPAGRSSTQVDLTQEIPRTGFVHPSERGMPTPRGMVQGPQALPDPLAKLFDIEQARTFDMDQEGQARVPGQEPFTFTQTLQERGPDPVQPVQERTPESEDVASATNEDGGFSFSKAIALLAPTLIGAAVGGKFGAATGLAATTEFLGSRQKKKEAEFEQGVNIAIKSGNSEALRKMAKGKGFDAIRQTLDGLADAIDEKDEQAKVNRVMQLVQGGFANKALAQAISLGDGSLVADIATIQRAGQVKALQQSSASADTLRKEFTKQAEKFILIRDAYTRVQAAGQEPSPAGDMALLFNYMKLLDPTSTVREGEYATAKSAGGAWEMIGAQYNSIVAGSSLLTEDQRADFMARTQKLYDAASSTHNGLVSEFTRLAELRGVDARQVIIDFNNRPVDPLDLSKFTGQPIENIPDETLIKAIGG